MGNGTNRIITTGNLLNGYATTATAAGTTTLTVNSVYQQYFTGTTTQTVTLPVASTLVLGQQFLITNNSTGLVTVQSSGANSIQVMAASSNLLVTCILTSGTTAASWNSYYYGVNLAVSNPPTIQKFTSGTTQTYTTPANVAYIEVEMIGSGGGGGGGNSGGAHNGNDGNVTIFGTNTANGGAGDTGAGGSGASAGTLNIGTGVSIPGNRGEYKGQHLVTTGNTHPGGFGGGSPFGTGGAPANLAGAATTANIGVGGAGGGYNGTTASAVLGGGGGSGNYMKFIIASPAATYTYTVGVGGTATGTAGTSGFAGSDGSAGVINVREFYNNAVVQVSTVASIQPTIQKFTSSSGTYTTPTGVQYISVRMVGSGGGGGGSTSNANNAGTGGTGGNTTFGSSLLTANGGVGGGANTNRGGAGGTASIAGGPIGTAFQGGTGGNSGGNVASAMAGGQGASSPFGGAGGGGVGNTDGIANTGSGGAGHEAPALAGAASGSGGGAGGYIYAIITNPSATYAYAVGAAGAAGTAGTSGNVGGTGGSGYIEVTEYYNNLAVGSTTSVAANTIFAGPGSGANANPGFRALVAADLSAGPSSYYANVYYLGSGSNYWSQTGTSFAAIAKTGTIAAPTVLVNPNFGTISKATSDDAGINFSAPRTGVIKMTVVVSILPGQNAGAAQWSLKLRETTTSTDMAFTSGYQSLQSTVNGNYITTLVGYFSATTSTTYNFALLSAISAGTLYIGAANLPAASSCMSFAMEYIT